MHSRLSLWRAFVDLRVLGLSLVYFGIGTATYGIVYFVPQIIKAWGLTNLQTGFVSSVPDIVGTIGMIVWGHFSDRSSDRRLNAAAALMVCTIGLVGLGLFNASAWSLIAMALVSIGINASRPLFWALPSMFLSRTAAAGAIALINALGNLGGIAGPTMLGWVKQTTGSFSGGILLPGRLHVHRLGAGAGRPGLHKAGIRHSRSSIEHKGRWRQPAPHACLRQHRHLAAAEIVVRRLHLQLALFDQVGEQR